MPLVDLGDITTHYQLDGPESGAPVVFSNSLGTDLHLWDPILPHLPGNLRLLRYDTRGHGRSSCPEGPYTMGALIGDAERLMDHLKIQDAVFVGLSMGGMIGQGLAVKRLDLLRGLVLSNTAAKIGQPELWKNRITTARKDGMQALADPTMERWFSRKTIAAGGHLPWCNMLISQPAEGYAGCCAAISGTDFYTPTSGLRLSVLGIAGADDGATPPDLVRETTDLIPGARFQLIRRAGHLACVDQPEVYAQALTDFLQSIGHI